MGLKSRPLGRRRRRLYWTVVLLFAGALFGAVGGWAIYRAARPAVYRPGEEIAEITRKLDLGIPAEAPELQFADVTAAAGLDDFRSYAGERTSQLPEDMGPGAAWGDLDGDGDDDLFLVSQGGPVGGAPEDRARSRLYENRGDGTFSEVADFPVTRILGMGAAWGDFDGDGDLDLVVTGYDALRLFRNDGGRLVREPGFEEPRGYWSGASWADFDRDGDLDLYVCGYVQYVEDPQGAAKTTQQYGRAVPYTLNPASFEPERNLLFVNAGGGRFQESAESLGVANTDGRSLGAVWHDFDEDGWPDLYVANDISDNALFLNRSGRFENVSHAAWVADYRGAMGLAVGDWNRDGDDDLFITHWIAQENALYDSLRGNLTDASELRFMDVADQRGLGQIALQLVGWGAEFADLDSDGWLDLVVANGSTFETDERPRRLRAQLPFVFWNHRGQAFHDLAPLVPALSEAHVSRGLALADYDLDGDVDLLFVDLDGGVRLLRNETPQARRIAVRLLRPGGAPVEGTRVRAVLGEDRVQRTIDSVSYLSQSSRTLHLGVGEATRVEKLEVHWPNAPIQVFTDLETDTLWELTEHEPVPRRVLTWSDAPAVADSREQLLEFWRLQRAGMEAIKLEDDPERAIGLFERALELDPAHEDSLYYLANCLATTGRVEQALDRLAELNRVNSLSHRGQKRWGTLRAVTARDEADLAAAVRALERAAEINPEETGVGLVLGEVHLMRGDTVQARQRLEWVVRTNPRAGEAFFMLAYLDWLDGNEAAAARRLEQAAGTRAEDWKPTGAVAEGDVKDKMHVESTPFEDLFEAWDGSGGTGAAFGALDRRLRETRSTLRASTR